MSALDRERWDQRYERSPVEATDRVELASVFTAHADLFPRAGHALELACGRGEQAIWLARRGMVVDAVDVSTVAIAAANARAAAMGVGERCHFAVADLDAGLPPGPPADVIMCHLFRDPRLDDAIGARLAAGGLLALAALSEVDAEPGPFRVRAGELRGAFPALDLLASGEGDGQAWILAARPR